MSRLWDKHEQIGAMVPAAGREIRANIETFGRTQRFLRAQAEHAGIDPDELEEFVDGMIQNVLNEFQTDDMPALCTVLRGAVWGAVLTATLVAQGLDPIEIEWDRAEELDTEQYHGGYIHGATGETVRAAGRGEDGAIVVQFNAGQPHQREERWCSEHFDERFVAVEDVPLLGGES